MLQLLLSRETILIFAVSTIFSAGGIVYLTLFHMPQANRRLERLEEKSARMNANIAWIRGRLSAKRSRP